MNRFLRIIGLSLLKTFFDIIFISLAVFMLTPLAIFLMPSYSFWQMFRIGFSAIVGLRIIWSLFDTDIRKLFNKNISLSKEIPSRE